MLIYLAFFASLCLGVVQEPQDFGAAVRMSLTDQRQTNQRHEDQRPKQKFSILVRTDVAKAESRVAENSTVTLPGEGQRNQISLSNDNLALNKTGRTVGTGNHEQVRQGNSILERTDSAESLLAEAPPVGTAVVPTPKAEVELAPSQPELMLPNPIDKHTAPNANVALGTFKSFDAGEPVRNRFQSATPASVSLQFIGPQRGESGELHTYRIALRNESNFPADPVELRLVAAEGMEFVDSSIRAHRDRAKKLITWQISSLRSGETLEIFFRARGDRPGQYRHQAFLVQEQSIRSQKDWETVLDLNPALRRNWQSTASQRNRQPNQGAHNSRVSPQFRRQP